MQRGAWAAHHAMRRPECLRAVGHRQGLKWLRARMVGGEGAVVGGVPILGEHHGGEGPGDAVDQGRDGRAVGNGQGAAVAEIVLDVDHEQGGMVLHGCLYAQKPGGVLDRVRRDGVRLRPSGTREAGQRCCPVG